MVTYPGTKTYHQSKFKPASKLQLPVRVGMCSRELWTLTWPWKQAYVIFQLTAKPRTAAIIGFFKLVIAISTSLSQHVRYASAVVSFASSARSAPAVQQAVRFNDKWSSCRPTYRRTEIVQSCSGRWRAQLDCGQVGPEPLQAHLSSPGIMRFVFWAG